MLLSFSQQDAGRIRKTKRIQKRQRKERRDIDPVITTLNKRIILITTVTEMHHWPSTGPLVAITLPAILLFLAPL